MSGHTFPCDAYDVLIAGAGPTGLALAAALRSQGVTRILHVDRQREGANTSRAAVIHARTLEVLEALDIVPSLLQHGLRVPRFQMRERDQLLMQMDFSRLDTAYPYTLMCPQDVTERVLLERLNALHGIVVRPARLHSVESGPTDVHALIEVDSEIRAVTARWVVGCDGGHSQVRESAGIPFEGEAYDETFVLADADVEGDMLGDPGVVGLFLSPAGLMVVAPLPGHQRFRVVATLENATGAPDAALVQALLDERGPRSAPARVRRLAWSSRFHVQHRLAREVMAGRVLLCGDAAHVHSPAGGQGMNTGIQDAMALAPPLARALADEQHLEPLRTWAAQRQEVARRVVDLTHRMTRMATLHHPLARAARNALLGFLGHVPGVEQQLARRLAELDHGERP